MKPLLMTLCMVLALMACQSAEPVYYNLSTEPGTALAVSRLIIKVQRPEIDETIDKPQMTRQDSNMRVEYDNAALWSEPLDIMIERVVAEDLAQRLPHSSVIAESSNIVIHPEYLIDLSVSKFGMNSKGQAVIEAIWSINTPETSGKPKPIKFVQAASHTGSDEAKALSQLLARISDQIAHDMITAPKIRQSAGKHPQT